MQAFILFTLLPQANEPYINFSRQQKYAFLFKCTIVLMVYINDLSIQLTL